MQATRVAGTSNTIADIVNPGLMFKACFPIGQRNSFANEYEICEFLTSRMSLGCTWWRTFLEDGPQKYTSN